MPARFASLALLEPAPTGFLPPSAASAAMTPLFTASTTCGPAMAMRECLRLACGTTA
jgi:hypothetical protein